MAAAQAATYAVNLFASGTVHHAAECGSVPELQRIMKEVQETQGYPGLVTLQNTENVLGCTPLHAAAERGHLNVVQYLIKQQVDLDAADGHQVRPLHLASITNRLEVVRALIDKGANPTKQDQQGDVPLHWAATKGHVEMLELLLNKGAAVDAPNREGWTALHRAVYGGHVAACRLLLLRGAGLQAVTADGRTPLHLAASQNHLGVMELLLGLGAATNFRDSRGSVALDLCISDAARNLIRDREAGRPPNARSSSSRPVSSTKPAGDPATGKPSPAAGSSQSNISHVPDMPRYKPAANKNLDADGFPVAMDQQAEELQPAASAELDVGPQLLVLDGGPDDAGDLLAQAALQQVVAEYSSRSSVTGYSTTPTPRQQQQLGAAAAGRSSSFRRSSSSGAGSQQPPLIKSASGSGRTGRAAAAGALAPLGSAVTDAQQGGKQSRPNQQFLQKYGLHRAGLFAP